MGSANSFVATNWNSIESVLHSDFISTCQNRLDSLLFDFADSDLRSGARTTSRDWISCFSTLWQMLHVSPTGRGDTNELSMSAFSSEGKTKKQNRRNINEKQFGINSVYDCNSVRGRISFLVTAGKHMCVRSKSPRNSIR